MKPILLITLIIFQLSGIAQTDTKFWFVAPDVTSGHGAGGGYNGGEPVLFRISTMNLPSTVTISQPANPGFTPITINIPANSQFSQDMTPWVALAENTPPDNILNKGFYIEATNLITVYYEVNTGYNPDIFALKGKNALGTEFYTPFQNYWSNGAVYTPLPYSAFDIVATEDNTTITITPKNAIVGHAAGVPFTITLNKGQTYCARAVSQAAGQHLGGSKIVSNKPIAVTIVDDSIGWETCYDINGDQIVPTNIIGTEYIIMKGQVWNMEQCFIIATQNGTEVFINGSATPVATINEGETYAHVIPIGTTHIRTTYPAYCYHIAGFGCELGGAILPPTNQCTGSTQVGFTRSTNQRFFLNIMVRTGAEDGFILNGDGPNTIIPAASFQPVPGSTDWLATTFEFTAGTTIPTGAASLIQNTKDIFHLGIINGENNRGCRYGYFSDFNALVIDATITNTESDVIKLCYGECAQLMATGGTDYIWSNGATLSDPTNQFPMACPLTTTKYTVTVSGACNMTDSASVNVFVAQPLSIDFTLDKNAGCSPFTVNISNNSIGASDFEWTFGNGDTLTVSDTAFSYTYINTTSIPDTFEIKLVIKNASDCYDTLSKSIIVFPEVNAAFTSDTLQGCSPLPVSFTNGSTGATIFSWDFGDGSSSGLMNPGHTFENTGTVPVNYPVQMVVFSDYLCTDTASGNILVFPETEALFTINDASGCSPFEFEIVNSSAGATVYSWDFGDGFTSSTADSLISYSYTNTGTAPVVYNITLIVSNASGCTDTLVREITVYPEVISQFTASVTNGCSPLEVQFTNNSTAAGNYIWEFGDGGSSDIPSPVHIFENISSDDTVFTVYLIAQSEYLCGDTSTINVLVHPYIDAQFTFEYSNGCSPFNVTFNDQSTGAAQYAWDFGDGQVSDTTVSSFNHLYLNPGSDSLNFNVMLEVENQAGCTDSLLRQLTVFPEVISDFSADVIEGCNPLTVNFSNLSINADQYSWIFGDGGSSSSDNITHVFENLSSNDTVYHVQLVSQSEFLCADTSTIDITVYSYLNADFTFEYSFGCSPFTTEIQNSSIGASSYEWDLGDGTDSTTSAASFDHVYINSGSDSTIFTVTLAVENSHGCRDSIEHYLTVFPGITAGFTADTLSGCHPLEVQFTNTSTGANDYNWEYGDGGSSSSLNPPHIFENFSLNDTIYHVNLIATSAFYCSDTATIDINVFPYIHADFTIEYTSGCSPFEAEIINNCIGADIYDWVFGNGELSTSAQDTFLVIYNNSSPTVSEYDIVLNIENIYGCSDSLRRTITVYPEVISQFAADTTQGCSPVFVSFENQSVNAQEYTWLFGDGTSSNAENPEHIFTNTNPTDTTYHVVLISSSDYLCTDTFEMEVTVFAEPEANFTLSESTGCSPLEIDIVNLSTGASEYFWDFGDGTVISTTDLTGSYTYTNDFDHPVTYELELLAVNDAGCESQISNTIIVYPGVTADFISTDAGCGPLSVAFTNQSTGADEYFWSFGSGGTTNAMHPVNVFPGNPGGDTIYNTILVAYSDYGCTDTAYKEILVYQSPDPMFSANPLFQVFPESTVDLDNLTEGTWFYQWNFGDSITDNIAEPMYHTYATWGTYNITLIAYSEHCSDSVIQTVQIVTPQPVAYILQGAQGCEPVTVNFISSSMYAHTYLWEFGDGGTSSLENPTHSYYEEGLYVVKLTVTGDGGVAVDYDTVVVYPTPTADFMAIPEIVTIPSESVFFNNLSNLAVTYLWDFGDGTGDTAYSPTHYYVHEGHYNVQLSVWSEHGCFDSIYVEDAVEAITNCVLIFPDAFTPTGARGGAYSFSDRDNDVFHPHYQEIDEYLLQIFNRWGELIFETTDINEGWDGYYRDQFCKQDVYVWKVKAVCTNGQLINDFGDVTLYR